MANRPRRLLAILHADLAGYVRLMEGSEDRTVDRLQMVRAEIWRPAIEAGGGSVVNIEGDSVLAEFVSANAALAAAIDIQERLAAFNATIEEDQRLLFRIGLHLGLVIVDEKTKGIFGDGVNLAARIQALAKPGGIAVSRALRDAVEVSAGHDFVDGGEHRAKNVSRPLQIYHVWLQSGIPPAHGIARVPGALVWLARHVRSARVTIGGPALWGAAAAMTVLVASGGYFAHRANMPATVSTAALSLSLSAEQLEQALAERRQADALALEKRQLEAEARRRAAVGADAKQQAEAELERAREARQKAEYDLAKLKADIALRRRSDAGERAEAAPSRAAEEAAQREAEDEAAGLRQAEEEARKKAVADAEAKRLADAALAKAESERRQAELEARQKAEVEQAALRRATEETQRQAETAASKRQAEEKRTGAGIEPSASAELARLKEEAEAAEKGLRLDQAARARLQVALTSLGFDTRGSDGLFGARTREMIAAWQKARRRAPTGFLTAAQHQVLLREGGAAVTEYDELKNAEDEARARTAVSVSSPRPEQLTSSAAAGGAVATQYDGAYTGPASWASLPSRLQVSLLVANGRGIGALTSPGCQESKFDVSVSPTGAVDGKVYFNCIVTVGSSTVAAGDFHITGEYDRKGIELAFRSTRNSFTARLTPAGSIVIPASPMTASNGEVGSNYNEWKTAENEGRQRATLPVSASLPTPAGGAAGVSNVGSYEGMATPDGFSGSAPRLQVSLQVANGHGVGALLAPGCQHSRFVVSVSPTDTINGEVNFNCALTVNNATVVPAGNFKISGEYRGKEMRLNFRSARASFSARLAMAGPTLASAPAAAASAPSAAPSDGLWRGSYACGAAVGVHVAFPTSPFTIPLELRVSNGAVIWKSANGGMADGSTLEIRVLVNGNAVRVTRDHAGVGANITARSTLAGHYDGNAIKATGRERGPGFRECTVALTRL